jgi:hypothetical protein
MELAMDTSSLRTAMPIARSPIAMKAPIILMPRILKSLIAIGLARPEDKISRIFTSNDENSPRCAT